MAVPVLQGCDNSTPRGVHWRPLGSHRNPAYYRDGGTGGDAHIMPDAEHQRRGEETAENKTDQLMVHMKLLKCCGGSSLSFTACFAQLTLPKA